MPTVDCGVERELEFQHCFCVVYSVLAGVGYLPRLGIFGRAAGAVDSGHVLNWTGDDAGGAECFFQGRWAALWHRVVYPVNVLPERLVGYFAYNPMAVLVGAYQQIFVYSLWPDWSALLPVLGVSLMLCVIGAYLFRKHAADMVDEL